MPDDLEEIEEIEEDAGLYFTLRDEEHRTIGSCEFAVMTEFSFSEDITEAAEDDKGSGDRIANAVPRTSSCPRHPRPYGRHVSVPGTHIGGGLYRLDQLPRAPLSASLWCDGEKASIDFDLRFGSVGPLRVDLE